MSEFLTHFEINFPPGFSRAEADALYEAEKKVAEPLIASGYFRRVWREPGTRNHWAIWYGPDADFVHRCYASFPIWQAGYGKATIMPLAVNTNDPGWPKPDPTPESLAIIDPGRNMP